MAQLVSGSDCYRVSQIRRLIVRSHPEAKIFFLFSVTSLVCHMFDFVWGTNNRSRMCQDHLLFATMSTLIHNMVQKLD